MAFTHNLLFTSTILQTYEKHFIYTIKMLFLFLYCFFLFISSLAFTLKIWETRRAATAVVRDAADF